MMAKAVLYGIVHAKSHETWQKFCRPTLLTLFAIFSVPPAERVALGD